MNVPSYEKLREHSRIGSLLYSRSCRPGGRDRTCRLADLARAPLLRSCASSIAAVSAPLIRSHRRAILAQVQTGTIAYTFVISSMVLNMHVWKSRGVGGVWRGAGRGSRRGEGSHSHPRLLCKPCTATHYPAMRRLSNNIMVQWYCAACESLDGGFTADWAQTRRRPRPGTVGTTIVESRFT